MNFAAGPVYTKGHQIMETTNSLRPFFEPREIVVVGATRTPGFGYGIPIMLQQQGWGDRLYLVNRSGGEMHGMKVFEKVADVPGDPDLAISVVPAHAVPEVLSEIGERGITHVIIESAGFAEAGDKGKAIQKEAQTVARKYGLRVMGPNCVGVINTENRFTSVETIEESLSPGNIGIIAQSGVFGTVLVDSLPGRGAMLSKVMTLGNRMDVDECDALEYLHQDPATKVIIMYMEGVGENTRIREVLGKVTRDKPVLILKSGRTSVGRAATASHTGSMSGEDALYDALFAQTGAVRANSLEELVEMARVFATQPLPKGNHLGIITSSGSLSALATDVAVSSGLILPALSQTTVDKVMEEAPLWMSAKNPLDVGPSDQYVKALPLLLKDPGIDMVVAITIVPFSVLQKCRHLGLTAESLYGDIAALHASTPDKPLLICAVGHRDYLDHLAEISGPEVPVIASPETAAVTLAALWRYSIWKKNFETTV